MVSISLSLLSWFGRKGLLLRCNGPGNYSDFLLRVENSLINSGYHVSATDIASTIINPQIKMTAAGMATGRTGMPIMARESRTPPTTNIPRQMIVAASVSWSGLIPILLIAG